MSSGALTKAAIRRNANSWGTVAGSPGAGHKLILDSESVRSGSVAQDDPGLAGSPYGTPPVLGAVKTGGGMTLGARFASNIDLIFAMALGATGGVPTTLEAGAYQHTIDFDTTLTEQFSLWIDKLVSVWEFDSLAIRRLTITAQENQKAQIQIDVIGRSLDLAGDSLGSVTEPENTTGQTSFMFLSTATVRLNTASGASLTTADSIKPSGFTLTIERPLSEDYTANTNCVGAIAQPEETNQIMVSGSLTFPAYSTNYNGNTWRNYFENETELKLYVKFCGPTIPSTATAYAVEFYLPRIRISEEPNNSVGGEGRIPNTVNFNAYQATSSPSGFPASTTAPVRILYTNARSTNILA